MFFYGRINLANALTARGAPAWMVAIVTEQVGIGKRFVNAGCRARRCGEMATAATSQARARIRAITVGRAAGRGAAVSSADNKRADRRLAGRPLSRKLPLVHIFTPFSVKYFTAPGCHGIAEFAVICLASSMFLASPCTAIRSSRCSMKVLTMS